MALLKDGVKAIFALIIYFFYWRNLSIETRFIRRNKLDIGHA